MYHKFWAYDLIKIIIMLEKMEKNSQIKLKDSQN